MGANKELQNEIRGYQKPNPELIMKEMIDCKDTLRQDELTRILTRIEPYNITNRDYFNLLIKTPLKNLKRVYNKYGIHGVGPTIRRAFSDEIHIKIMQLENELPEKTIDDIFQEKVKIAIENKMEHFIWRHKGKIYYSTRGLISGWIYTEISEL